MYMHVHEVLVRDKRPDKYTVSWAECSLVYHRVFRCSKCLSNEGRVPLGAPTAYCLLK